MEQALKYVMTWTLGTLTSAAFLFYLLLAFPEKAEKLIALLWKALVQLRLLLRWSHKNYVKYDIQGHVNDFIKRHAKDLPGFQVQKVKLEWVDAEQKKQAFLDKNEVVVRIRKGDRESENIVRAIYLFVSTSFLARAKRYLSPSLGSAIDLYTTTQFFKEEKPDLVDVFLESYLHPGLDDNSTKTAAYFEKFDVIAQAGLFFAVFVQEMDHLGQKVFGGRRDGQIHIEVDELVQHLEQVATRRVGDETTELSFVKQYCKAAIVIVGKKIVITKSIQPYVNFIRDKLAVDRIESVYLIGRSENQEKMRAIAAAVDDLYEIAGSRLLSKVLRYKGTTEKVQGFAIVLRTKKREIYTSSANAGGDQP